MIRPPNAPRRAVSTGVQAGMAAALAAALFIGVAPAHAQPIFQPNSAVAGSEFSGSYDIGNTIDGSGLPAGFSLASVHAEYDRTNHWTTDHGAIASGLAFATYYFDSPVAITHFHMWNHLSNGVASNGTYGVSRFNLYLRDQDSNTLFALLDESAIGTAGYGLAQSFNFARVVGVSEVRIEILANQVAPTSSRHYTGLAEVAFSDFEAPVSVPEPESVALLATGLLALATVHQRRRRVNR